MEARDEVCILLLFDDLLELERKPRSCIGQETTRRCEKRLTRGQFQLCLTLQRPGKTVF